MNLAEPIIQSYIYTDVYNSLGGGMSSTTHADSTSAGLPISKLLVSESTQNGGAPRRLGRHSMDHLSVPAGLVLIEEPRRHKITYKRADKIAKSCQVVPDELFDKLVELTSVPGTKRPKTESKRPRKSSRETQRAKYTK